MTSEETTEASKVEVAPAPAAEPTPATEEPVPEEEVPPPKEAAAATIQSEPEAPPKDVDDNAAAAASAVPTKTEDDPPPVVPPAPVVAPPPAPVVVAAAVATAVPPPAPVVAPKTEPAPTTTATKPVVPAPVKAAVVSTAAAVKVEKTIPAIPVAVPKPKPPPTTTTTTTSTALPLPAAVKTTVPVVAAAKNTALPVIASASARRPPPVASQQTTSVNLRASSSSKSKKKKSGSASMSSGSGERGNAGENVGRWTAEEHRLFLQGLEQHGKGWKKIASLIKTRSVVQIRTHAQKYFQKLAKARQNGDEGEITMEGRGGVSSVASVSSAVAAQSSKRRRQTIGTKRKAIQSVVSSACRQGKKIAAAQASAGAPNPVPPLPAVAPTLANFVLPNVAGAAGDGNNKTSCIPSISTSQGQISGPALEDSIFRFLTPAPVATSDAQVNEVARQAGANPITLPTENPSSAPTVAGGEISPTGVADLALYPSWTDAKDMPTWYSKGADVDALLDVGDSLDWLADTGDLHETYQPPAMETTPSIPEMEPSNKANGDLGQAGAENNTSVSTLPHVDSNVESVVPPLPSLFDGSESTSEKKPDIMVSSSSVQHLKVSPSVDGMDAEHLQVFENPIEEQDFVSTILENNETVLN